MSRISRFNPYQMQDELILALNTGRKKELQFVQEIIARNVAGGRPPQHILLHGPRGIGKSFFLRLLQVHLAGEEHLTFVLLPEEQLNVYQPADLMREIKNTLVEERLDEGIGAWDAAGMKAWKAEVAALEAVREARGYPHLVLGLENFDLLFSKGGAFEKSEDQFLLREFLTETPWLTLIATTLYPDLATRYDNALFHFFARHELRPWQEAHHETYLDKRNKQAGQTTSLPSRAQIKALCRFTGGSPRIAVIMADVLAGENVESTADTLEKTIDELTPFYQDLLHRIPPKSKLLFDALIRGGEPCSQSELAARVGTTQNVISQSFAWLQNNGYLRVERPEGEKQKLYAVRDRLFAHYYRMRYVLHGSGKSILSVMGEFLTHFFTGVQLKERAAALLERGQASRSRELMHIALEDIGINSEALELWIEEGNQEQQAWAVGQFAVNKLLIGEQAEAWQWVDTQSDLLGEMRYEVIKQLGDAVAGYQAKDETAKAYALGRNILGNLWKRRETYEPSRSTEAFFIGLLEDEADVTFIEDLMEAATDIFGKDVELALEGIRGVVAYLKSDKAQNVLVKMAPETRKVVETLVEELDL